MPDNLACDIRPMLEERRWRRQWGPLGRRGQVFGGNVRRAVAARRLVLPQAPSGVNDGDVMAVMGNRIIPTFLS